jgi:hypothetical protein
MPARRTKKKRGSKKPVASHEQEEMYLQVARQAGETLKSFSRNKRFLREIEVDMCAAQLVAAQSGYFKFASTSVREFCQIMATLGLNDNGFLVLAGVETDLIQHVIVVLNLWDPNLDEDDDSQELHFVVALFNVAQKQGLLVDPLTMHDNEKECDEPEVTLLRNTLADKFAEYGLPLYLIESRCLDVQRDGYNCGIHALTVIEQYVASGGDLSTITEEQLDPVDIKAARTRFSTMLYGR